MEQYDKEFLKHMKTKYKLTLDNATNGTEPQIIEFAVAWDIWKQAKNNFYKKEQSSITEFMTEDHSRLYYILEEFIGSKNQGEGKQLFLEFKSGIERHMKWEEDILFPIVRKKLEDDSAMIDELLLQHGGIRDDLKEISASLEARDTSLESDLEQLLESHDKMEEEGIYPWIDDYVDDKARREALLKMV